MLLARTLLTRTLVPRTLLARTALALTRAGLSFVEATLYTSGLVAIAFLVAIRLLISDFFSMDMAFFLGKRIFYSVLTSLYLAQRLPNRMPQDTIIESTAKSASCSHATSGPGSAKGELVHQWQIINHVRVKN
jgi:hypothetical protein